MPDATKLLITLLASLMITSSLISFFVVNVYGYQPEAFGELSLGFKQYTGNNDFVNSCNLSAYETSGSWSCTGAGAELMGSGKMLIPVPTDDRFNGVYANTYNLKNPNGADYDIVITDNGFYGGGFFVRVDNEGFHLINRYTISIIPIPIESEVSFIPYAGASSETDVSIQTMYNSNMEIPSLQFVFNNNQYTFENQNGVLEGIFSHTAYSGGVVADNGIIVSSTGTTFTPSTENQSALDGLKLIWAFITNVLAIIVWNINPNILPWELNLLFIKTQCMGIFVCIMSIVRG